MENHFCTCPTIVCPCHPSNHDDGCDPCIKDNIEKRKMPACMFKVVHEDTSNLKDFSIEGFVGYFMEHREEYLQNR